MTLHTKLVVTVLLTLLLTQPVFAGELATNFKKAYTGSNGTVTFNHQAHADRLKDCAFCHNGLKSFGGTVNEAFGHKFCLACHQTRENAPVDCQACHKST